MYELPTSIDINGEPFKIRDGGDFRMVLHCFKALNAEDLTTKEKILASLLIFYEKFDSIDDIFECSYMEDLVKKMFSFMNCDQPEGKKAKVALINWEKDSVLISSAVNDIAGKELRAEEYVHWWTFMGYYMAIGECPLSHIVAIRSKIAHNEKLEKHEKKFRSENPQYFDIDYRSTEQKEADDYIYNLWNGGNN